MISVYVTGICRNQAFQEMPRQWSEKNLISVFKSFENTLVHVCFLNSLLDAVMNEPVGLQQDDDVTVLNRPAAEALYMPRHSTAQDSMDDEI